MNGPLYGLSISCVCIIGVIVYAFYSKLGCDPQINKDISSSNQASMNGNEQFFTSFKHYAKHIII